VFELEQIEFHIGQLLSSCPVVLAQPDPHRKVCKRGPKRPLCSRGLNLTTCKVVLWAAGHTPPFHFPSSRDIC
jgi:hypothetical protein